MAQKAVHLDPKTFSCPICYEFLTNPVVIPCGHTYCRLCITERWDREDKAGTYSCPDCKKTFGSRPEVVTNTMLATVAEELKKASPPDHCYAIYDRQVACDVCTWKPLLASKTCMVCLASFCDAHLQPHRDAAPLRRHQLVEPTFEFLEHTCYEHKKRMNMFCRTDQECVCRLCCDDQHKGHDVVSVAAEWWKRREELQESREAIEESIRNRESLLRHPKKEAKDIKACGDQAVEQCEEIYTQLIGLVEERGSHVRRQIRYQQEAEAGRIKGLLETLEREAAELRSADARMQQLAQVEDHASFLRGYTSVSEQLPGPREPPPRAPRLCFEELTAAVADSGRKMLELREDDARATAPPPARADPPGDPETREDFLRYARDIRLDPNTSGTRVLLTEASRWATATRNPLPYPDHYDRLGNDRQVLSRKSLTGRCYWEVRIRQGAVKVAVVVTHRSFWGSKTREWFGEDGDSKSTPVVGVYLDPPAGLVSFYNVSDTMELLRSVRITFAQPVYAGLTLRFDSVAQFVQPQPEVFIGMRCPVWIKSEETGEYTRVY